MALNTICYVQETEYAIKHFQHSRIRLILMYAVYLSRWHSWPRVHVELLVTCGGQCYVSPLCPHPRPSCAPVACLAPGLCGLASNQSPQSQLAHVRRVPELRSKENLVS